MNTAMKLALDEAARKNPQAAQQPMRKFDEQPAHVPTASETEAVAPAPAAPEPSEGKRRYIAWSSEERLAVALKWQDILNKTERREVSMMDALDAAQSVLPFDRRRPSHGNEIKLLRAILDSHATSPAAVAAPAPALNYSAAELDEDAKASERVSESAFPTIPADKVFAPTPAPAPVAPQMSPASPMGPLEQALAGMVAHAVGASIGQVVTALREEVASIRAEFQHLLCEHHDSMMAYWDPEYKKMRDAQAVYVPDESPQFRNVLEQVRIRPKKVLVSGGQTDQFHPLRMHFRGVEFTFVDGREPRKIGAGGFYDLVVCTKYTNHSARDTLINLHGNKVVMVDGAITAVINVIRQRLGL